MRLLVLVLALSLAGCPAPPPEDPDPPEGNAYCRGTPVKSWLEQIAEVLAKFQTIIGGEPSVSRRATAFVQSGGGYCSGTVVGPHTILTAAHCIVDQKMVATVGAQNFRATEKLKHPDYTRAPYNDLALLFFDDNTLPGPVIDKVYSSEDREDCAGGLIAQGWGKNEFGTLDLRESPYRVVKENQKTLYTKQVTPGGICFGDSGGPLYAIVDGLPQLAGVTSTTYAKDCMTGGDHVNLFHYKDWLEANVR